MADLDPIVANILLVWLTFFGACIGSFLNVVVYRLPLGKSLSDPPSHCPKCGHPIRWFDNVPVLGWLWLGGKCRDCKEPISVRYPIVEFVGGAVFGVIAWLTIRRGGDASLAELMFFVLGLSSLVMTFFAAGLIERDAEDVPWRLFLPVLVISPMMPWLVQEGLHLNLYVVDGHPHARFPQVNFGFVLYIIVLCITFSVFCAIFVDEEQRSDWFISSFLVALFLGVFGQAVVFFAGVALFVWWLTPWRDTRSPQMVLAVTTLVFIVLLLCLAPASAPLG